MFRHTFYWTRNLFVLIIGKWWHSPPTLRLPALPWQLPIWPRKQQVHLRLDTQSVHTVTLAIHQQRAAEQRLMLSVVQYVINLKTIIYLPKILCLCSYRRPWWAEQLNYFPLGGSRGLFIYFLKKGCWKKIFVSLFNSWKYISVVFK